MCVLSTSARTCSSLPLPRFSAAGSGVHPGGAVTLLAKDNALINAAIATRDAAITVNKDNEKWTVARDKGTKLAGDLKPGTKVTIYYKMVATEVEVKEAKKK